HGRGLFLLILARRWVGGASGVGGPRLACRAEQHQEREESGSAHWPKRTTPGSSAGALRITRLVRLACLALLRGAGRLPRRDLGGVLRPGVVVRIRRLGRRPLGLGHVLEV